LATVFPAPARAAVRFDHQAQFHPLKYLHALADRIPGDGSTIYEHTRALSIDERRPCTITTDRGEIVADHVIVATHLPFPLRGLYYARTHPESHPAIAYRVRGAVTGAGATGPVTVSGMFLGIDGSPHSLRGVRIHDTDYLVSDAPAYKTGHEDRVSDRFRRLIAECEAVLPISSLDFAGKLTTSSPRTGSPTSAG
jgi:glycine/D-amino acid oxidase-like deaminating enzyme